MKARAWACVALGIGLLVGPRAASAGEYHYWFEAADYQSADWTLKNDAAWNATDWDHIRLTPSAINKKGAAWLNARQIVPTENWTYFMRGRTTDRDVAGGGADAMSMILQTAGPDAVANQDGTGYGRYLRVAFDSYYNTGDAYNPNTLKLFTNGVLVASLNLDSALELNNYFNVTVTYTAATKQLEVRFKSDHSAKALVSGTWMIDMGAVFGDAAVTPGFDAWGWASYENHEIVQARVNGVSPAPAIAYFNDASLAVVNQYQTPAQQWGSTDWHLLGDAFWADDAGLSPTKRLRVTNNQDWRNGAAWVRTCKLDPTKHWWFRVDAQLSYPNDGGADGITLVLQTAGTNALPANTGYFNRNTTALGKFLAFDLDSWDNGADDPYQNMVGVYTNGVRLQAVDIQSPDSSWPLEASAVVHLRARYYPATGKGASAVPSQLIVQFWVDGQAGEKLWQLNGFDPGALFGGQPVTVGLLSQSGNSGENHDVTFFYMLGTVADVTGSYDGAKLGMKWPYARGVDCDVQWSPSLMAPDWKTLAVSTMLGGINGATPATEYLTQVPATNSPSFFRLIGK